MCSAGHGGVNLIFPFTQEADVGGSLEPRSSLPTGQNSETLSHENKTKDNMFRLGTVNIPGKVNK
jgi:hypothetical protein